MKTISKVLLLLNFLFIVLSCDIKNNKTCKDQLSSSIRQINSIHKGFYDNRDSENHLNLLSVRSFYNDYIDRLNNLSNELAKINITKKYQKLSSDLSGLITYEIIDGLVSIELRE